MNDNTARDHDRPSPEKLRKIMAQISNMLAKADDPSCTPAEADQNRERAEVLMQRYRVQEAELSDVERAMLGIKVQRALWRVCVMDSEFAQQYRTLASYVVAHIDAKAVFKYEWDENGTGWYVLDVFGFESDLMYGEKLWNGIRLAFGSRLEPKHDPSLSEGANVYAMRNAGMERARISDAMGWSPKTGPFKVSKVYKAECASRGEDANVLLGKGNSVKQFRADYANSFCSEMWSRLSRMRHAAGADSVALVMANRKEQVEEAMYEAYPNLRPKPVKRIGEEQGRCPKCAAAKSGYCRAHSWLRPSRSSRSTGYSAAGAERGRSAARSVDLGQSRSLDR